MIVDERNNGWCLDKQCCPRYWSNFLSRETHVKVTAKGSPSGTATTTMVTYNGDEVSKSEAYRN